MKKSVAALSPIVPGKYFVSVERLVREQYQTQVVDADSEDAAREQALETFFAGSVAYMTCTQVEPPQARAGGSGSTRATDEWSPPRPIAAVRGAGGSQ